MHFIKEKKNEKILTLSLIVVFIFTAFSINIVCAKVGDIIGTALHTDIVAYINHYAIPSYIANGQSCIVVEDLKNFGFNVIWNSDDRSLEVSRNTNTTVNEITVNKFEKTGTKFSDILQTDINVYVNGKQLTSYALNGYTPVCEYIVLEKIFLEYNDGTSEWIEYGYVGGETLWDKYNNPTYGKSIYK